MVNLRNPQFRYGFALSPRTTFYVSVEKASSDVLFKTPQFSSQPNAPAPDGAIRLRRESERGHFQVSAIFRDVAAFLPNGETGSVFGWGVNTSLGFKTVGRDNVIFAVAGGRGVSRYIQDTSGLGIDAEPDLHSNPPSGSNSGGGGAGGLSTLLAKEIAFQCILLVRLGEQYRPGEPNNLQSCYIYWHQPDLECHWSLNVGAEFLYGWSMDQNHKSANAPRIQFSAKYNFVKVGED